MPDQVAPEGNYYSAVVKIKYVTSFFRYTQVSKNGQDIANKSPIDVHPSRRSSEISRFKFPVCDRLVQLRCYYFTVKSSNEVNLLLRYRMQCTILREVIEQINRALQRNSKEGYSS